ADDDAAYGWRDHDIHGGVADQNFYFLGKFPPQPFRMSRVSKNLGALQIFTTVKSARKTEMAVEIGAGLLEQRHGGACHPSRKDSKVKNRDTPGWTSPSYESSTPMPRACLDVVPPFPKA